jgi:hypothetical protein
MDAEYNHLGKHVSQTSNPKRGNFLWVATTILDSEVFVHEQQVERKKESLELEKPCVIPLFPPVCKYNYNWPRDYGRLNMCECLI